MRRHGLEWLWRLVLEPRRLWKRYVLLNPAYLSLLAVQRLTGRTRNPNGREPSPDAPGPRVTACVFRAFSRAFRAGV